MINYIYVILPRRTGIGAILVGVKGLEPPTSCSQSRRATNCATPRNNKYYIISAPKCQVKIIKSTEINFCQGDFKVKIPLSRLSARSARLTYGRQQNFIYLILIPNKKQTIFAV